MTRPPFLTASAYARYRSSLALDRFIFAEDDETRRIAIRWAHAWAAYASISVSRFTIHDKGE